MVRRAVWAPTLTDNVWFSLVGKEARLHGKSVTLLELAQAAITNFPNGLATPFCGRVKAGASRLHSVKEPFLVYKEASNTAKMKNEETEWIAAKA